MTVDDLIAASRLRLDDRTAPYLCATDDLVLHLAEGEREAAMRASLLYDDSSAWLSLPLTTAGTYPLDSRVWRIDRVSLLLPGQARPRPVDLTGIDQLRRCACMRVVQGRPQQAAHVGRTLHVWPVPDTAGGTMTLAVYRLPLEPLEGGSDEPEIDEPHHMGLVDWVLYRSYSNKDSELYDPPRAAQALADFTERFGERPDANTHRRHNERRSVIAPYGGF